MKTRGLAFLVLSSALVAVASAALLRNTMPVPRGPEGRTHHYKPIGKPLPTDEHQITLAVRLCTLCETRAGTAVSVAGADSLRCVGTS